MSGHRIGQQLQDDGRGPGLVAGIESGRYTLGHCAPWLRDLYGLGAWQEYRKAVELRHENAELRARLEQAEHERNVYFERMTTPDLDARRAAADQRIDEAFEERLERHPWPSWAESVQLACEAARPPRAEALAA